MCSMSVSGQLTFSVCARILNNGISSNSQSRLIMSLTSLWVSVRNYVLERKLTIHTSQSQHYFITPSLYHISHVCVCMQYSFFLPLIINELIASIIHLDKPGCMDTMYCKGDKGLPSFLLLLWFSSSNEYIKWDTPLLHTDNTV